MVPFGLVPLLNSLVSHFFFFFFCFTPPEGSIPIVSLFNSFLAYCSPWSIPEASHNSLLISLFSCRIRGRSTHWDQTVRTEIEIVLVALNIWLPVDEVVITYHVFFFFFFAVLILLVDNLWKCIKAGSDENAFFSLKIPVFWKWLKWHLLPLSSTVETSQWDQ